MSIEVKQKIKEVADDFAMPAKKLIEIVGKFYEKPKSSSQNLTEDQLNVIFDYITQQNQIDSIEQVFAAAAAKMLRVTAGNENLSCVLFMRGASVFARC